VFFFFFFIGFFSVCITCFLSYWEYKFQLMNYSYKIMDCSISSFLKIVIPNVNQIIHLHNN